MKENYFRFINWPVYEDAKLFANNCFSIVKRLPREYRFEIGSQIIRSSTSVALNIAEGSGKSSDKDFNHFLNISTGSLFETIAALDILRDNSLLVDAEFSEISLLAIKVASQLKGLKKSLIG